MGTLNFTNLKTVSEGIYTTESTTYNVSATIIKGASQSNMLQTLSVQVRTNNDYIGDIRLENNRRIMNLFEGSNFTEHLDAFQFILDSILNKTTEAMTQEV